ncbi:selenium cofactor biosynthesis protein YqeC [Blautia sp. MSJ-19]|uniref:selenium cofactor biosynthesis protein YqeC n=1 Tax=Blautia sp. MSJ-19 TaxID=2841517 RepID=UPI0020A07BDF|nr:selenium cofactor biosynthesis protein YqeC [Blautia sp. MSJ-19]
MQMNALLNALKIDLEKCRGIAVVGGGGKTSLIFRMMESFVSAGKKVIVTTTTHMAYEPERPFAEDGNTDKIRHDLETYHYTVAASLDRSKGKIGCFSEEKLEKLRGLADILLIEADGAKRLPLKVPGEWEPVIPDFVELVIGVVGMDALGEPIQKTCHRPEKVADFLGKGKEEVVTEDDIVKIAVSGDALRKCVDERAYRVLLNKADIPGKAEAAERIAGKLEEQGVRAVWGSLQKENYNLVEKLTLIMLAAGNSRRFGSNKLLYEINGAPMYLRTLHKLQKAASELGNCEIIVVTQYEEIAAKAQESGARVLINPHPERGISSSMQIGLAAAKESSACLFTVSDQPWLTAETIVHLVHRFQSEHKGMACTILGNKTGNPCIFSQKYYQELQEITGDKGGKQIIKRHPEDVAYLEIEDAKELVDVDVPYE